MIKRLNKITALMVAASSIISMSPAFAKGDKLTYSDGDISNAIAYKDGKYIYYGSKDDKDYGVYYNNGKGNETLISDANDLDDSIKYGTSNVEVPNSKDPTEINLEDGTTATDGDSLDDKLEDAKVKLKSKLAKANRYGSDVELKSFKSVTDESNMFGGDEWYEYTATGNPNYVDSVVDEDDKDNNDGTDDETPKSQITVSVRGIWGPCTIAGVSFSNIYSVQDLEKTIKSTQFTGYSVKSTSVDNVNGSDVLTIVFTTTEDLGNTVPDGFIKGLSDWTNGYAEAVATPYEDTSTNNNVEPKSQITVSVNGIWGPCTIGGVSFSNIYSVQDLEKTIKSTQFTGYSVKSTSVDNVNGSDVLTIVFTTTEDLGNTVPDGFIKGLSDWTNGYAEAVATPYEKGQEEADVAGIKVEVNAFYSNITIAGQTFSPSWGSNLPESLKTAIGAADFGDYKVKSVKAESTDQNTGKVTIIFSVPDGFTTIPNDFVKFDGNTADWQITASPLTKEEFDSLIPSDDDKDDDSKDKVIYYGYTDGKGNYIDCSKIANIKVFNGEDSVKIKEFNDKKVTKSDNDDTKLKVKIGLPTIVATLGQDQDYIYSLIDVPVVGSQPENGSSHSKDAEVNLRYVQKISKKQGGQTAEAYLPSGVSSYQLNNNTGWDEGDNWAYMAAYYLIQDSLNEFGGNAGIRIIDGNIYVAKSGTDDDGDPSVSYGKLKLKSAAKVTLINDGNRDMPEPLVFEDFANDTKANDWCIDANSNVWAIYNGKIKKSAQGRQFQDTYRADGSLNKISVYDDDNLIAWDEDAGIYTTAEDIKIQSDKLKTTDIKTGWIKSSDGKWHLYDLSGNESKGWINYGSVWYYFDEQGNMQTGWLELDGKSYYLNESGVRSIGWKEIDGKWYYFNNEGVKEVNTTIDGYNLDLNGIWIK